MATICIQCALRAIVAAGKLVPPPTFEEEPEEHLLRVHPNPDQTQREREWLDEAVALIFAQTKGIM